MRFPSADIDLRAGVMRMQSPQGPLETPLPSALRKIGSNFLGLSIDVEADRLVVRLPDNIEAIVELGVTGGGSQGHLARRRVIYLDQNRWSTMVAWRHGNRPVNATEAAAAERLSELVHGEKIILPISAGHMVETGRLYDVPRVALASTMLELSRGWQLRNPVEVRGEELKAALTGETPVASGIVSLGPDVFFTRPLGVPDGSDLPGLMSAALPRLVNVSSLYEALVDSSSVPDEGGRAAAARWAKKFEDLGRYLSSSGKSREQVLRAAAGMVINDLLPEITQLGPRSRVESWLGSATEVDLEAMPYISRYLAVVFGRLRQPEARWTSNDLIDLNFLCSSAGYADIVVGERKTIGDLRTAKRVPSGAALAATLSEAVAQIDG